MSTQLRGTGVALVTPFNPDGSVDFPGLKNLIEHLIAGGVEYLVPMGTTGETATLSKEEKKKIFDFVLETNNNRVPLVAGIGGNNTSAVVDQVKNFKSEGFSAILSVSPYYNKPAQEGIFQHYKQVAENSPLPIILYNVPGRTGSNMTAQTTLRLAELENIIGIKEASGNFEQFMEVLKYKPKDFKFISGDDALALPMIALGAEGVISVVGNAFPKDYSSMIRKCLEGKFDEARTLHYKLTDIINMLFAEGSPAGVKAFLKELAICGSPVRLPLVDVSENLKAKILNAVKNY
ncbi:4-hydroxy-tetrahydrodipicolinate synthase [Solitalea sp. MAHUQ-68]|uniref:4-hydroxy-tetrahydrodipicolinate synthase n=1 Tax=Solitalea agri TaxID=2953739 RepID=A0A9X2JD29_9SPHI|nr:4-hydroxy-tetrahydrodipicolinate synthase [Solitalea agri]MCO4292420.1 4-hydroxy-tetrahydrodipicolinate synthase [Solitalea agri]